MKRVLVFGTFDGIHPGHIDFFKQAKKYGDYLIVVVARNVTVKKIKKRLPLRSEKERLKEIRKCRLIDEAVPGHKGNPYRIIKEINPDVICLGYDQKSFVKDLRKELKRMKPKIKIYRMKACKPEKFHSSIIKKSNERRRYF